jgi:rRNA maturation endonuclease Nob1
VDSLTLISIVSLVGAALLLILYPLWQQARGEAIFQINRSGQTLEEFQARYRALLAAIRDLMFDHEMGKVATEDYETLLARTKLEAATIRRQIDQLSNISAPQPNTELDAEIETLIARLRDDHRVQNDALLPEVNAELELLKNVQVEHALQTGSICATCGNSLQPDDAFCSRCGQSVPLPETKADLEAGVCPQCGYATQVGDAFCAQCGTSLNKDSATQDYKDIKT